MALPSSTESIKVTFSFASDPDREEYQKIKKGCFLSRWITYPINLITNLCVKNIYDLKEKILIKGKGDDRALKSIPEIRLTVLKHPKIIEKLYSEPRNSLKGFFQAPMAYQLILKYFSEILNKPLLRFDDNVMTAFEESHHQYREVLNNLLSFSEVQKWNLNFRERTSQILQKWCHDLTPVFSSLSEYACVNLVQNLFHYQGNCSSIAQAMSYLHQDFYKTTKNRNFSTIERTEFIEYRHVIKKFLKEVLQSTSPCVEKFSQKGFTESQIKLMILLLLFGGQETTSSLLATIIYQLAIYPNWQERIFQEICSKQESSSKGYENQLKTLKIFLMETIRLYSPVYTVPRTVRKDLVLTMQNQQDQLYQVFLPKGSHLHHCPILMGRDENYFPEPLEFDPHRHLDQSEMFWYPFGLKQTICPGRWLATLQIKAFVCQLVKNFKFQLADRVPFEQETLFTLKPKHDFAIKLTKRNLFD